MTRRNLPHTMAVRFHDLSRNVVILTPEMAGTVGVWAVAYPSIQDEAKDVARSAPQAAHYHADITNVCLWKTVANLLTIWTPHDQWNVLKTATLDRVPVVTGNFQCICIHLTPKFAWRLIPSFERKQFISASFISGKNGKSAYSSIWMHKLIAKFLVSIPQYYLESRKTHKFT